MENNFRLQTWDYVTFVGTVTFTAGVGVYHIFRRGQNLKNARSFLVRSDDIGIFPLVLSSVATYLSAVGFLGFPMETYTNGVQCFAMSLQLLLSIAPSCYLFLPVLYNLKLSSVFEYLELRYNRCLRICASLLYTFQIIMYTSCIIYAPSLALNQVTGLHLWGSVLAVGCICVIYTSMGGIKSVVWADAAQVTIMFGSLILLLVKGILDVGGMDEVWTRTVKGGRATIAHFTSHPESPYTIWAFVIGGTTATLSETVANQMQVQRYLSSPNLRAAQRIVCGGLTGTSLIIFLTSFLGMVIYATYANCDPYLKGVVASSNQIVPFFGVQKLSFAAGLPGFFVASMFCATLSTLSSSLNSLASIALEDYIIPLKPNLPEKQIMIISKLVAVFYGVICIALVGVAESMGSLIHAVFIIFGAIGGPIFSLFVCGMVFPWITPLGASVGFFAGLGLGFWAAIGTMMTEPHIRSPPLSISNCSSLAEFVVFTDMFENAVNDSTTLTPITNYESSGNEGFVALYSMAFLWYAAATVVVSVPIAVITSIITGVNDPYKVDEGLLHPFSRNLCCKLHSQILRCLGYGIPEIIDVPLKDIRTPESPEECAAMLEHKNSIKIINSDNNLNIT